VLQDVSFLGVAGLGDCTRGLVRLGKNPRSSVWWRHFTFRLRGPRAGGWRGPSDCAPRFLTRTRLGVVLQESFLFDGTIREETWRFRGRGASEEEILAACRIARVDEFAERFPEGYDTIIGERGREIKRAGNARRVFHRSRDPWPIRAISDP